MTTLVRQKSGMSVTLWIIGGIIGDTLLNPEISRHRPIRGPAHFQSLSASRRVAPDGEPMGLNWKIHNRPDIVLPSTETRAMMPSDDKLIPPIHPRAFAPPTSARAARRPVEMLAHNLGSAGGNRL
jgi:hypothetical protein